MVKVAIIEPQRLPPLTLLQRSVIGVALALTVLLVSGCSSLRLAYGQATWLSTWWLDRYADFNDLQKPRVQAAVDQWFAWHRHRHLADDAALLEKAADEALKDATATQACRWVATYERKRDLYLAQIATAVAELAPQLDAGHLTRIEARLAKVNQTWREEQLQPDPAEQAKAAVDRVVDRAEMLYGRLDAAQRQFVKQSLQQSPWDPARWYAERLKDQQALLGLLRRLARPELTAEDRLAQARTTLLELVQPSDEAQRQFREQLLQYQCQFAADLHNRTTAAQRRHAGERLQGWGRDLRSFLGAP